MIEIPFIAGAIAYALAWLAVRIIICARRGSVDWKHEALLLLMFANLAAIIRFSFFPFDLVDGHVQPLVFEPGAIFPLRVNLVPFKQLLWFETTRDLVVNLVGNFAMFIPTGTIVPIIWPDLDRFWKSIPAGMLIPICIELAQLPFAVRATDVDDLILNTAGIAVGYMVFALIRRVRKGSLQ